MAIQVSSSLVPRNGNTWPVVEDVYVKGGYRTVSTRADMLAIPAENLKPGSSVFVRSERSLFVYEDEWRLVEQRPLRVGVIGDSMSYGHTDSLPAWPAVLEEKLNGLGSNVKVLNASLGGASFSTAGSQPVGGVVDLRFKFGTQDALDHLIAREPDMVILQLGANDSGLFLNPDGSVDAAKRADVVASIDYAINKLRTELPGVRICYAYQVLHDVAHWYAETVKNKHLGVVLGWTLRSGTNTVLDNVRCADNADDALSVHFRNRVEESKALRLHIVNTHPDVHVYDVDYFKVARMGGLGTDTVHLNAIGHQMVASMHFKALSSLPEFPDSPMSIWNEFNSIDDLFESGLVESGDGWIEKYGGRFNFVNEAFGYPMDPYHWWSPVRPSIQVRLTVDNEVEVLASHLTPNSVVKAAIGLTGAWTDLGTTDSRGTILTRKFAFDLGAAPGLNEVRLWVRNPGWDLVGSGFDTPVVFGPFEINL